MCYLDHYHHLQTCFPKSRFPTYHRWQIRSFSYTVMSMSSYHILPCAYNPYTLAVVPHQSQPPLRLADRTPDGYSFFCHFPSHATSSNSETLQNALLGPYFFLPSNCASAIHCLKCPTPPDVSGCFSTLILSIAPKIPRLRDSSTSSHFTTSSSSCSWHLPHRHENPTPGIKIS